MQWSTPGPFFYINWSEAVFFVVVFFPMTPGNPPWLAGWLATFRSFLNVQRLERGTFSRSADTGWPVGWTDPLVFRPLIPHNLGGIMQHKPAASWKAGEMVLLIQASPTIPLMIIIIYSKRKPNKLKFLKNVSLVPLCLSRLDVLRLFCFRYSGTVVTKPPLTTFDKETLMPQERLCDATFNLIHRAQSHF